MSFALVIDCMKLGDADSFSSTVFKSLIILLVPDKEKKTKKKPKASVKNDG